MAKPSINNPNCVHTVIAMAADGRLGGTWEKKKDKHGEFLACKFCGRWYGRMAGRKAVSDQPSALSQKN